MQPGHHLLQILCRPGQYGVGAVVGGNGQGWELVGESLDALGAGEHRNHPAARARLGQGGPLRAEELCGPGVVLPRLEGVLRGLVAPAVRQDS